MSFGDQLYRLSLRAKRAPTGHASEAAFTRRSSELCQSFERRPSMSAVNASPCVRGTLICAPYFGLDAEKSNTSSVSDQEAKDGPSMISRAMGGALVLRQPIPKRGFGRSTQSVCSNSHNPRPISGVSPRFPLLEEKIITALRPFHSPVAFREPAFTADMRLDLRQSLIEAD